MKRTSISGGAALIIGLIPLLFFLLFGICVTYPRYPIAHCVYHLIVPMFLILAILPIIGVLIGYRDIKDKRSENLSPLIGITSSVFSLLFLFPYYLIVILIWRIAILLRGV